MTSAEHPLQHPGRKATLRDLRRYRHLVVRESNPERDSPTSVDVTQRWTVSHIATAIEAARKGYGFTWLPEELIRDDLASGALKPAALRDGGERFAEICLIFADPEHARPATRRLAEIIRERARSECARSATSAVARRRARRPTTARS